MDADKKLGEDSTSVEIVLAPTGHKKLFLSLREL